MKKAMSDLLGDMLKPEDDEEEDDSGGEDMGLASAYADFVSAMDKGDSASGVEALKDFVRMCGGYSEVK